MDAPTVPLTIVKGKTTEFALLYAEGELEFRAITGVVSYAPLVLTVPAHGLKDDWPIQISGVKQPRQLNSIDPLADHCYTAEATHYTVRVVDADTIRLVNVNGTEWPQYTTGGVIEYAVPADITGWTARAMFRKRIEDATPVLSFTTEAGADGLFLVDPAASAFTLLLSATVAEQLTVMTGVWDAEAIDPSGRVYQLVPVSPFSITNEVTRVG